MKKQKAPKRNRKTSLPTHFDFSRGTGDLDAEHAWKNFGGKSLDEAYSCFCERPDIYQEDFMFMGNRAFHFYFPVIDRYLRNIAGTEEFVDSQASILCAAIAYRYEYKEDMDGLHEVILSLCDYVSANSERLAYYQDDIAEIAAKYSKLRQTVETALSTDAKPPNRRRRS
jgi:hypothetical protein